MTLGEDPVGGKCEFVRMLIKRDNCYLILMFSKLDIKEKENTIKFPFYHCCI